MVVRLVLIACRIQGPPEGGVCLKMVFVRVLVIARARDGGKSGVQ
jgi:hypothetical protein